MNPFHRRLAFILFATVLLKACIPESTWGQVGMFAALGFAIWQLRSAVFRACIERLLNSLIFYVCDALCVTLFFIAYRVFFFQPLGIFSALAIGFVFALLPLYRYRKLVRTIRNAIAQRIADSEAAAAQSGNE